MNDLTTQFRRARERGVPLLGIITPDPTQTISWMHLTVSRDTVMAVWDAARGLQGLNKASLEQVLMAAQVETLAELKHLTVDPVNALDVASQLPEQALAVFLNLPSHWHHPEVAQAVWNLRDLYKGDKRTLVLLAPDVTPPAILEHDLIVLEEPMPNDQELAKIGRELYDASGLAPADAESEQRICVATRGLSAFEAEQAIALSLNGKGMNYDLLWERKARQVENTPGLRFYRDQPQEMGGISQALRFIDNLMRGPEPVEAFVYWEEIEKSMAGSSSDHAGDGGVAKYAFQTILTQMEENEWTGMVTVGAPGTGKSLFSRNVGAKYDRPVLAIDIGATRHSLVGASEQAIRALFRVIKAVAGTRAYFIATCNKVQALPPELKRRFTDGVWYFGMPDEDELRQIWRIQMRRYNIGPGDEIPTGVRYTGADVRNICRTAYRLGIPLRQAAQYIVPVAVSDPGSIEALEEAASGRFLSASYPGVYRRLDVPEIAPRAKVRAMTLGGH